MSVGDRFQSWIEELAASWRERLGGWVATWLMAAFERWTSSLEPGVQDQLAALKGRTSAMPGLPPEMLAFLEAGGHRGNVFQTLLYGIVMALQAAGVGNQRIGS